MKKIFVLFLLIVTFCKINYSQQWTFFNKTNFNCTSIAFEKNLVWIGSPEGVIVLDSNANFVVKYSISDGLINNNIKCIAIDKNGNKWFGSDSGVSVFNDKNWTTYNTYSGLVSNKVNVITADSDGHIWIGTDLGVSMFDGDNWTLYSTENGLENNNINSIAIDAEGKKWFGTNGGVSMFDGINWTTYTTQNGLASNHTNYVAIDKQGNKWFSTSGICQTDCGEGGATCPTNCSYITKYDGTNWTHHRLSPSGIIYSIEIDNNDSIWYACSSSGKVNKLDGTEYYRSYKSDNGLIGFNIFSFAIDVHGNKWFGTECGVSKFDGKNWNNFFSGIAIDKINSIALDKDGNKWFGTEYGVLKYDGSNWTSYIPTNEVYAVDFDSAENLWCGTGYNGVYMFDGITWINYREENGLIDNYVNSIAIDPKGNKWCTTMFGVSKFDGINWTNYTKNQIDSTLFISGIVDIKIGLAGAIYLGTTDGLYRHDGIDGHKWIQYGVYYQLISDITTDIQKNIWIISDCGISKISDLSNCIKPAEAGFQPIRSLEIDAKGNIWTGDVSGNVYKYNSSYWKNFVIPRTSKDYLEIKDLKSDMFGNIWIGTESGLWMLYDNTPDNIINTSHNNVSQKIISPNPVSEDLRVITPKGYENAIVDIYDINGLKIFSVLLKETENKISLSNLSSGVYIIKIATRNGMFTQKFIKL
jgi:ligand-binding sensor domain-containing protein